MTIQRLSIAAFLTTALLLAPACDKGEDSNADGGKTAQKDKPAGDTKPADDGDTKVAEAGDDEAGADGGEEPADDDEYAGFDDRVAKAAKVARKIEEDPSAAETVLAENDMDREALDSLMFEIARDPDLTGQYRIARGM
jgi:hypothetical protein